MPPAERENGSESETSQFPTLVRLFNGIVDDIAKHARGYEPGGFTAWIVIHSTLISAGYRKRWRSSRTKSHH